MAERKTDTDTSQTAADKAAADREAARLAAADSAQANETAASSHFEHAAGAAEAHDHALRDGEAAAAASRGTGQPAAITPASVIHDGDRRAADSASLLPPGFRRVQIAEPFTLRRPDGSTQAFRPDGTNCDQPGTYQVDEKDIALWPAAFGVHPAAPTHAAPADQTSTPAGHSRVRILRSFLLNRDDGSQMEYKLTSTNCGLPGVYDMPAADANHWLTQHCSDQPPPRLPPVAGTPEAIALESRKAAKRRLIEDALDQEEKDAVEQQRASRGRKLREQLGDSVEVEIPGHLSEEAKTTPKEARKDVPRDRRGPPRDAGLEDDADSGAGSAARSRR